MVWPRRWVGPFVGKEVTALIAGTTQRNGVRGVAVVPGRGACSPVPLLNIHAVADGDGRDETIGVDDFIPTQEVGRVLLVVYEPEGSLLVAGRAEAWRKIRLVASNADSDVTGFYRQSGSACTVCAHDDDRLLPFAGEIERYITERDGAVAHRGQIHAEGLLRQTGVEAVGDRDCFDCALGAAGRRMSAETDADVRAICWTRPERSGPSIASPRHRPWAQLSRSDSRSLPKPASLVAKPMLRVQRREIEFRRMRAAKFSHARREVAVDFLESHLFELRFEALGLFGVPLWGRGGPEPVED